MNVANVQVTVAGTQVISQGHKITRRKRKETGETYLPAESNGDLISKARTRAGANKYAAP